jgi:pyruvate/2-oxoglutarate dehydrogenase complex dihydrolipoamide dehydrogenase (E3) component
MADVDTADVIVVGLGVGGEEVAERLADAGLDVVGIERRLVGGECPYWGCIPSKMMIRAANLLAEARRVDDMAGHAEVTADWAPVAKRIREEATDHWDDKVAVDRFIGKGGRFVRGSARLVDPRRVQVGERVYEARRGVVVSVGTSPLVPPIDGLAGTPFWTNHEAIEADTLPASLLVIGGGSIGVELAQAFARFGVAVTIIEAADRLISREEPEASALAAKALTRDGVAIQTGTPAKTIAHGTDGFTITLDDGSVLTSEKLLVAIGRTPNIGDIGLDAVGLDPRAKTIEVDERMRAADGVWALGAPVGHGDFTHISMYQAGIIIRDILGKEGPAADYRAASRVTFTDPEIGAVGMTEAQAREQNLRVRVAQTDIAGSSRGWIHKAGNDGFIKLIMDEDSGVLVGATSAGPVGGEVLGALSVAVHAKTPVHTLRSMIYAYPTFHRAIEAALAGLDD